VTDTNLIAAVERCRKGTGSLEDYKAAFAFADDTIVGLRKKLKENAPPTEAEGAQEGER